MQKTLRHILRLSAAIPALLLTGHAAAEPGIPCAFYGMNPGAPLWNGQILLDDAYAQAMAASGARAARIDFRLDDAASWDAAALARYDKIVDAALNAGLEPLGLFAYEAVPGGQSAWNDDPDGDGYNNYVDQFAETTKTLFSHYKGKIRRWEIWNEPNCWSSPDYINDPQNAGCTYVLPRVLAKLLAETYVRNEAMIQSGDISLVSGGLFAHDIGGSFSTAGDYLSELYGQGVWDWMEANKGRRYPWDEIGYHVYIQQGQATDGVKMTQYLDDIRDLATAYSDDHPFRMTEIGWTTQSVSEDVQAADLTVAYLKLAARSDVSSVYWFSFRDSPAAGLYFGVTKGDGSPKAALAAMQSAAMDCVATGGAGGTGGTGGAGGTGTSGGAAGSMTWSLEAGGSAGTGTGGAGTSGTSSTTGGSAGQYSGGPGIRYDRGCGCHSGPAPSPGTSVWLAALAAAALLRRRRSD